MSRRVIQPGPSTSTKPASLLSVEEVAAAIHRHPEVVRRQARNGRLPGEKIGRVWFFKPERLARAGFAQFAGTVVREPAQQDPLLLALSKAGMEALQLRDLDSIFQTVGRRLADVGLSSYYFLVNDQETGVTMAHAHLERPVARVEALLGRPFGNVFLPFERIPRLHQAFKTRQPQYLGDADEMVGRIAATLPPESSAQAHRISEALDVRTAISAPFVTQDRVVGAITVTGRDLRESDLPAVMAFANQTAAAIETSRLLAESRQLEDAVVKTLAGAIELRVALKSRSAEHAELAQRLAQYLGLGPTVQRRVHHCAMLQDLGKLSLPDAILQKKQRLNPEERAVLMTHPVVAADLLNRFLPLADLAPLVRSHHESFNGEGYPDGLTGEAIPVETRIVSVINGFFNVTFELPFRDERTLDEGLEELARFSGANLDPAITAAFIRMFEEARAAQPDWYRTLHTTLLEPNAPGGAGPKDILSVADSRELRIIYRIAQETTAVLDLDTLLRRIVSIIREVMGYYMVSIILPSEEAGVLRLGAHSGYAVDISNLTFSAGEGITGWVFQHGTPQIVGNVSGDARYIGLDPSVVSELAFPLISRGRVVGVLNAESQEANAFSETDLALMTAVGSQLASCLEVAQLHDTLKREATHDPLTRLYNRRLFLERIEQSIGRAETSGEDFSLVFLDVDELKRINDTYGHLAGDALLREVANALMDAVRGEDVVARYGGDEFVVLLPSTPAAAAAVVAQRISEGIARHRFMAGRQLLHIPGVSLGTATYPDDGRNAEDLLAAADQTLYAQKRRAS